MTSSLVTPSLAQVTDPQDILVINFGLWSNSINELKLHVGMFEAAFEYHRHSLPNRTFWRETSAQHYSTLNGERPCSLYSRIMTPGMLRNHL